MSGTPWLSDSEQTAWRGFMEMHAVVGAELARRLAADSTLSYQDYEVLVALTDNDSGQLRVMEIAEVLGWEKSRVSHQVSRMTSRGLVEKRPCESDRRGFEVSITDVGRSHIERAAPGHVEAVRELFIDRLSANDLASLTRIARKVLGGESA
ncbi:MAG: MarR family transcriptional regulator [Microthrixaceae bacterium]